MKNVLTYLPPPAAQKKARPAALVLNQRVGVNSKLGKYELLWQINHQLLEHVVLRSQASGQSMFELCTIFI